MLRRDLEDAELGLRQHPDFHEVHEDDLAALVAFRSALGIKEVTQQETSPRSVTDDSSRASMGDDYSDDGDSATKASIGTSGRRRLSQGGASVSSVRSKLSSAQHSLSPLYEEDVSVEESPDDAASPPPTKRRSRGRRSIASSLSVSTAGHSQPTIAEGSESDDESS